jgi:hypothetical protein
MVLAGAAWYRRGVAKSRKSVRPTSSPVLVPREGAEHPAFAGLRKRDGVEVLVGFEAPLTRGAIERLKSVVHGWIGRADWRAAGGRARFAPIEVGGGGARIVFTGAPRPREVLTDLVRVLPRHFRVRDIALSRRPIGSDGVPGAPLEDARLPKQRGYRTEPAWWKASFDPKSPQPYVEDEAGMFSVAQTEEGQLIPETRPASLFFDGVRIAYGLGDVRYPRVDERTREVSRVVRKCLTASFHGKRPALYNHKAERDVAFDKISRGGRVGYAFAIGRDDEMISTYPGCFRFREHELMSGLVEAIARLGLEPVIHWDRGEVYIVNVWERLNRSMRPGPKKTKAPGKKGAA